MFKKLEKEQEKAFRTVDKIITGLIIWWAVAWLMKYKKNKSFKEKVNSVFKKWTNLWFQFLWRTTLFWIRSYYKLRDLKNKLINKS